ncbi:hypothetical protein UA32_12130 [Photobacterium angustum]|uniref:Lipoprotein n=1 Tax=Photobacterium angustum TaxID=661 RepID=A0ABX5GYM4_PHOAN|nr:hypothetical protein [Photobacterium angustum]KJG37704.1 hypothetical protein UA32_12130 [Photobacterium angustum]PSX03965.1 hypothetical protein C0W27_20950 [Photobacterium angustum]
MILISKSIKPIAFLASALALTACSTTKVEDKVSPEDLSAQILKQENKQVLDIVPSWYLETHVSSRGAIYENATAKSKDLQFSLNQAVLLAEQMVVKKLASEFSSVEINEASEANGGSFNQTAEQLIEARINQAGLFGHTVSKKEVLIDPVTGEYRSFVQVYLSPAARADVLKAAVEKDATLKKVQYLTEQIKQLENGIPITQQNDQLFNVAIQ